MPASLEGRIFETGQRLYRRLEGQSPSVFRKDFWVGKAMDWSMSDPEFKTSLFRFIDVFPSLNGNADIARYAREYFGGGRGGLFGNIGLKTLSGGIGSRMAARFFRSNIRAVARQFIAGEAPGDALPVLAALRNDGLAFTVSLLGEAVVSEREADLFQERYIDFLDRLTQASSEWRALGNGGELDWNLTPRVNISVKPSSLYSQMSARAFERSVDRAKERLRPILRKAMESKASVVLDMESRELKSMTLAIYRSVMDEPEFRGYPHTGVAIQAYLRETGDDVRSLIDWARARGQTLSVRLVKGAYWDSEVAWARQQNWPEPVFLHKNESDAAFETIARLILENHEYVHLACGSHNLRSQAFVIETARDLDIPDDRVEFQILHGMAEPVRNALLEEGRRVRMYTPVGEMIPGMAYLVRRLLENTSNESFLRQGFVEKMDPRNLLRPPESSSNERPVESVPSDRFRNEPLLDWTMTGNRERFAEVLDDVRARFPVSVPLAIGGERVETGQKIDSRNPNRPDEIAGVASSAGVGELERAVRAASDAYPGWRGTPATDRAEILLAAARAARRRRTELAALEVFETGKGWDEADGDVCEAIDFLEYYGREMIRLDQPQDLTAVPGETTSLFYEPRGVVGVVAPWNFPIAISMGMVSAAIVAGNTVVYKPSSESPACGFAVWELFDEAGLPPGVLNFVPGSGAVIGDGLVTHPDVWLVAFTGSRDVGLRINRLAAESSERGPNVKRVIAEMGGKNAIVVDTGADLDAAVRDVIRSAFGYQGQKCSACSRVIAVDPIHDALLERLKDAAESIELGPVEDPAAFVGAVISQDAAEKIRKYIEIGKAEGSLVVERLPANPRGHVVPLTIFAGIQPDHRLAQEEIFGPVLSVIRAADFDDALEIANRTPFALTGAVFSRSPSNIAKAAERFQVGNLYINRGSTGALVGRHPFGGFKMSGVGSKAGGPDYLRQFMVPRNVVENTIRRSFTPEIDDVG